MNRRSSFAASPLAPLLASMALLAACGDDASGTGGGGTGGEGTSSSVTTGGEAGGAGEGGGGGSPPAGPLDFQPSNLPDDLSLEPSGSLQLGSSCPLADTFDTSEEAVEDILPNCAEVEGEIRVEVVEQASGPDLLVLVMENFQLDDGVEIAMRGDRPLVIVATDTIRIAGSLSGVDVDNFVPGPGGALPGTQDGTGPGAGRGSIERGGGGGSFCGLGGHAASGEGGEGGPAYGNPELTPLRGGSSGGSNFGEGDTSGGLGGGALQLVAGQLLDVQLGARINLGGGGSRYRGAGGGAGGALLLEAPEVVLEGIVAVNGGAGSGANTTGAPPAEASGDAAAGSTSESCPYPGGDGSSSTDVDGGDGLATGGDLACTIYSLGGGGGGGAGRIRINTRSGEVTTGDNTIISPSLETDCSTLGRVLPLP